MDTCESLDVDVLDARVQFGGNRFDLCASVVGNQDGPRLAVLQDMAQVRCTPAGVDRHRDEASAHHAEMAQHRRHTVVHGDAHVVTVHQVELLELHR